MAKVVDETNNPEDLHFYWKGTAYDDDFQLQDRLQRLYRDGMMRFLKEEVTYIENKQIDLAFRRFKNDPDATKKTIKEYFRALKFFSDNDFLSLACIMRNSSAKMQLCLENGEDAPGYSFENRWYKAKSVFGRSV